MDIRQVKRILEKGVEDAGGIRAYARLIGVSPPYVSDVLKGNRSPGPKILKALRLSVKRTVTVEYQQKVEREAKG
jgi:DNA-binding transcriptional regulator YdaS (Cro superfamily)